MTETTHEHLIDFDKGVERMKGEEQLLKKLCGVFVRSCDKQLCELEQALNARDLQQAQKTAHSIKGGAGTIEAGPVHRTALAMEMAARNEDPVRLRSLLPELDDLCRRTRQAILEHYPDLQG
jgi:two-component system sensor histidine kinase/response regulator